jgi:hypothetical protein
VLVREVGGYRILFHSILNRRQDIYTNIRRTSHSCCTLLLLCSCVPRQAGGGLTGTAAAGAGAGGGGSGIMNAAPLKASGAAGVLAPQVVMVDGKMVLDRTTLTVTAQQADVQSYRRVDGQVRGERREV